MLDYGRIMIDGGLLALVVSAFLIGVALFNKRLFLNKGDIPADILAAVPPKTAAEKRLSIWLGVPFILLSIGWPLYSTFMFAAQSEPAPPFSVLFLHALAVLAIPFFVDLFILDWLIFCTLTPKWFVFPGTEGFAGYKDYGFHLRAHARGTIYLAVVCTLIATIVTAF